MRALRRSANDLADEITAREIADRRALLQQRRAALALGEIDQIGVARRAAALAIAINVAPRAVLAEVG